MLFAIMVALGLVVVVILWSTAIQEVHDNLKWQREAVIHGAAHYDDITGVWRWNTVVTKEPEK